MSEFERMLLGFSANVAKAMDHGESDYLENGLVHCGKCHTPKQVNITIGENSTIVWCLCRCAEERQKQEDAERHAAMRKAESDRNRQSMICDRKLLGATFEGSEPSAKETHAFKVCEKYCDKWQEVKNNSYGLYIYGNPGCGKTFLTACMANRLIDDGERVLMTSLPRIINDIFAAEDKNAVIRRAVSVPLLILDDFGTEQQSAYNMSQVYRIIDDRYNANKPLIITSNIDFDQIVRPQNVQQKQIYSRIVDMCTPVKVEGAWRMRQGMQKSKELHDLLGV